MPVNPILRVLLSGAEVSAAFPVLKNYFFSGVSLAPTGKAQQQLQENRGWSSCQRELGNTRAGNGFLSRAGTQGTGREALILGKSGIESDSKAEVQ